MSLVLIACLSLLVVAACGAQTIPAAPTAIPAGASTVASATTLSVVSATSQAQVTQAVPQSSSGNALRPTIVPGMGQALETDITPAPPPGTPGATAEANPPQAETSMTGKTPLTSTQQKIDSNLLITIQQSRGEAADQPRATGIEVDAGGRTVVDITAFVTPALIDRLNELDAEVLSSNAQFRSIRARIALNKIEMIAAQPDVIYIQPKQEGTTMPENSAPP